MIKIIGAALVIGTGTSFGFFKASEYVERPRELQALIVGLQMLETEITYASTPLPDAFRKIGRQVEGKVGLLFMNWGERIANRDGRTPAEIVRDDWTELSKGLHLVPSDQDHLLQWSLTLGLSDRVDQIKHIRLASAGLSAQEQKAREEMGKMAKLWRYMGALTAAAVVLLLY